MLIIFFLSDWCRMAEGSATDTHAVVRSYIFMVCLPRVHDGLFVSDSPPQQWVYTLILRCSLSLFFRAPHFNETKRSICHMRCALHSRLCSGGGLRKCRFNVLPYGCALCGAKQQYDSRKVNMKFTCCLQLLFAVSHPVRRLSCYYCPREVGSKTVARWLPVTKRCVTHAQRFRS